MDHSLTINHKSSEIKNSFLGIPVYHNTIDNKGFYIFYDSKSDFEVLIKHKILYSEHEPIIIECPKNNGYGWKNLTCEYLKNKKILNEPITANIQIIGLNYNKKFILSEQAKKNLFKNTNKLQSYEGDDIFINHHTLCSISDYFYSLFSNNFDQSVKKQKCILTRKELEILILFLKTDKSDDITNLIIILDKINMIDKNIIYFFIENIIELSKDESKYDKFISLLMVIVDKFYLELENTIAKCLLLHYLKLNKKNKDIKEFLVENKYLLVDILEYEI
ncbi:MAG: hypothetical protein CMF62_00330 [Magnetococcales bacterium]|nr:hypothetical protein [Magnetococcales bacterium]|tara:strand:- start:15756 stop:16586 length:831 start_codon:yes stop_codon:yes gene_type:complete